MQVLKILQDIEDIDAREKRHDPFHRPRIEAGYSEDVEGIEDRGIQRLFELRLRLSVRYWANQAQKSDARKRAEQSIQDVMYRDVISRLQQIRGLLDNGTRQDVELALIELIGEMRP